MKLDEQTPGHCILPDASRARVLLVASDGGGLDGGAWSLPTVRVNEEWWSPTWLGRIIAQVRRTLGAETTVLRHVRDAPQSGLNCPASSPVSCSGAACPGGAITVGDLSSGVTMGTLAAGASATLSFTCNVQ